MPIAATSSHPSTYAQDKLNLLDEHFAKRLPDGAERAALRSLAGLVFERTALDVFKALTVQEMAMVVERIQRAIRDFCAGNDQVLIRTGDAHDDSSPAFITVLRDRPFIVDTITELFRAAGVKVRFLLHPIVPSALGPVSVTYLQTDDLDAPSAIEDLRARAHAALSDLCLATDHYPLMTAAGAEFCTRLSQSGAPDEREAEELLRWLIGGAFVFLGLQSLGPDGEPDRQLGLFDPSRLSRADELARAAKADLMQAARAGSVARFSKIRIKSEINRRTNLLLISVRSGDRALSIAGMLSSQAARAEASGIPFIRAKLARILELEGFVRNTHDYKEIVSIFNSAPRWLLLSSSLEEIREETRLIMEIEQNTKTRLTSRLDDLNRLLTITVIMPRQRLSADAAARIRTRLERALGVAADEVEFSMEAGDSTLVQIYFLFPAEQAAHELNLEALQIAVEQLTLTWDETLYNVLEENVGKSVARRLFGFYAAAFPERYKAAVPVQTALEDIRHFEALSAGAPIDLALVAGSTGGLELKIYKRGPGLILGSILPILENAGFIVEDESSHYLQAQETTIAAIHTLRIRTRSGKMPDFERDVPNGLAGLRAVFNDVEENDRLNALLFEAALSSAEIAVLRMLLRYLLQIRAVPARASAFDALVLNPQIARLLYLCFHIRFSPGLEAEREERYAQLKAQFAEALRGVKQLAHDRVLRAAMNVIDSAVRTNFFIPARPPAVSIKIDCAKIAQMPKPRPLFEIFVSGKDLEGVHLRGGRIARGGIRWSERPDDFRTEVLGLVKTQTAKNAIIVPVGAKGGFVVKSSSGTNRQLVEQAYRLFIRSLLQITDNRVGAEVIRPPDVVCHDEPDTYLVVAADKGTASFSDIANQIAVEEFGFWLGDAFASGGSAGYDHKKLGITAKGAWEATRRHFHELGIDPERDLFSLVGIGDMAGDVFGNGLLLCVRGKLIAAFNHSHIFIDPEPNVESSYAERARLFNLPGSTWADYNRNTISEGGGIFGRNDKEIPLSPQARQALGITATVLSGPELIQAVLRAPVDLLWNGGIGTYVKSSGESHAAVNDPLNDEVRINASELRAKIVSEGGNLGFTQQARIEFSRLGGRINTDAIDNSGGVNMSDIEVNWKILLAAPLARGEIDRVKRDALLTQCAAEAAARVTERNSLQSLALSLGQRRSIASLKSYAALIEHLERTRQLDRALEQLPRPADLSDLAEQGLGLTRPELAVLLAYAKMDLAEEVLASDIPESPNAQPHLFAYFPPAIAARFPEDVRRHPLHREIIAAQLANSIIERLGSTFVHRFSAGTARPEVVLRAYLVAEKVLGLSALSIQLRPLDCPATAGGYLSALATLGSAAENAVRWLLERSVSELQQIEERAEDYAAGFRALCTDVEELFEGADLRLCRQSLSQLSSQGLSPALARAVCALSYTGTFFDVCRTAFETKHDVSAVARLFSALSADYRISALLVMCRRVQAKDRWEEAALKGASADIRRNFALIVRRAIETSGVASRKALDSFLAKRSRESAEYLSSAAEADTLAPALAVVQVLASRLRAVAEAE